MAPVESEGLTSGFPFSMAFGNNELPEADADQNLLEDDFTFAMRCGSRGAVRLALLEPLTQDASG